LWESLRLHLANVAKYAHQAHSINLSDLDILQHHLDTHFSQLNTSVELEFWQEAFRSVEDVHNLLVMAKKAPRPAMMANYYDKLAKIFLTSGNSLYHAAAWGRYIMPLLLPSGVDPMKKCPVWQARSWSAHSQSQSGNIPTKTTPGPRITAWLPSLAYPRRLPALVSSKML